jgi:D-glucosaminate-6-phosphate ammonia-lyase
MTSVYRRFGVPTVINACGTVTRLSGGRLHPEVAAAMAAASSECVDMIALQAGACRVITRITGAQAAIVTSGASAAVLLGAAACLAGLDPARDEPPSRGRRRALRIHCRAQSAQHV